MADKKISALTTLAQASIATTADFVPIVDTSATETKKATPEAVVLAALAAASSSVGIGTASATAALDVNGNTFRLRTNRTPATSSASGNAGDICWDSSYVYVCVAANTWKRIQLGSW